MHGPHPFVHTFFVVVVVLEDGTETRRHLISPMLTLRPVFISPFLHSLIEGTGVNFLLFFLLFSTFPRLSCCRSFRPPLSFYFAEP